MDDEYAGKKSGVVRTLQIITLALAGGVLVFAIVAFVVQQGGAQPGNDSAFLSLMMAVVTIAMVLARIFVAGLLVRAGCRRIAHTAQPSATDRVTGQRLPGREVEQLLMLFQTTAIAGGALLEGAAFCNLIAFLIEGHSYSLILGLVLMVGILAGYPTRRGLEEWLEQRQHRIREIRDMSELS